MSDWRRKKIKELQKFLEKSGIDSALFVNRHAYLLDPNVFYFTGVDFLTSCFLVVPKDGDSKLYVPLLDYERAESSAVEVVAFEKFKHVALMLKRELRGKKVGVNGSYFTLGHKRLFRGVKLTDISDFLYSLRSVKVEEEIRRIRKAVKITKKGLKEVFEWVKPGVSETQIKARLEYVFSNEGTGGTAFPTIVASGKKTSQPHSIPSPNKKVKKGDLLLIDCGAKYKGYSADITRVDVVEGCFTKEQEEVMEIVKTIQKEAQKFIKPGVKSCEVDELVRGLIMEYGYEPFHSAGHGIGLEIHESPSFKVDNKGEVVKNGMVFTLEPGIYLPGEFGIRIEDDFLLLNGKVKRI
ncbi:MAG: aminopeptidase P family protein [Candidatus Aenigmarchaeota archaeon]|nr:aminopeptidase P family protein [Candidatus Aenigmarchaeota archaeon]